MSRWTRGMSPFKAGAITLVAIALIAYFGLTSTNPFAEPVRAEGRVRRREHAAAGAPVRIAGVEVGKVTKVEGDRRARGRGDDGAARRRAAAAPRRAPEAASADPARGQHVRRPAARLAVGAHARRRRHGADRPDGDGGQAAGDPRRAATRTSATTCRRCCASTARRGSAMAGREAFNARDPVGSRRPTASARSPTTRCSASSPRATCSACCAARRARSPRSRRTRRRSRSSSPTSTPPPARSRARTTRSRRPFRRCATRCGPPRPPSASSTRRCRAARLRGRGAAGRALLDAGARRRRCRGCARRGPRGARRAEGPGRRPAPGGAEPRAAQPPPGPDALAAARAVVVHEQRAGAVRRVDGAEPRGGQLRPGGAQADHARLHRASTARAASSTRNTPVFHVNGVNPAGLAAGKIEPAPPLDSRKPPAHRPDVPCETQEPPNLAAPSGPAAQFGVPDGSGG